MLFLAGAAMSPGVAQNGAPEASPPDGELIESLSGSGDFSELFSALGSTEVLDDLSGGPFTLFAPTDQAFARMPAERRAMLLLPENEDRLESILEYHLVPGRITAGDLAQAVRDRRGRTTLRTASGDPLTVRIVGDALELTDQEGGRARISRQDISHSDGLVHVIDAVLIPRNVNLGFTPYR
ncbi:fasciclin domain-containing protein [Salinarimonas ramus]|nr:fasciclin domain-containing protein [Salinarimonas ramus]